VEVKAADHASNYLFGNITDGLLLK
jgi:hypothetical protein